MFEKVIKQIPNALSISRVLLFPIMFWYATKGDVKSFLIISGILVFTDIADGFLARKLNVVSNFGRMLDSLGDGFVYWSFALLSFYLMIDDLQHLPFLLIIAPLFFNILPHFYAFIALRKFTNPHLLISSKISGIVLVPSLIYMLLVDVQEWIFWLIAIVAIAGFLEEMYLYVRYPEMADKEVLYVWRCKS